MGTTMDIERVIATAPAFYHGYIRAVGAADVETQLAAQIATAQDIFGRQFWDKRGFRYAEGKWTPTEMLGHLIDGERVFMYRAMRFARNDQTELPGFEEDDYVAAADFNRRGIDSLLAEFVPLRQATIALYTGLTEEERWRSGTANGSSISVYALVLSTIGHFNHHVGVLRARY